MRDRSVEMALRIGSTVYFLTLGDLTESDCTAVVNAANSTLLGGGGVDGAIHRRGGPRILEECRRLRETPRFREGCPPGEAVLTTAGQLEAQYVIHTVGPLWRGGHTGEAETLANCYRRSLALAREQSITSVAFPSISTGAFGYPVKLAAPLAQVTVLEEIKIHGKIERAGFVLYDEATFQVYRESFAELTRLPQFRLSLN